MSEARRGSAHRGAAKREGIRAAAQGLFLERGFAGTSTDAVAREAGVSKETLYRHFRSKEELLSDVLAHLIADVSKRRVPGGQTPVESHRQLREALLGLGCALVSNLMQPEYLALARVIVAETPRLPQLGYLFRSTVPDRALSNVAALLESAQKNGVAREVDTGIAARMFVGPLLTYILLDGLLKGDAPPVKPTDGQIEAVVDLYLQAVT